jgi:type I restriction enzyme S subunit
MGSDYVERPLVDVAFISSGKRPPNVNKTLSPDAFVPIIGGGGASGFTTEAFTTNSVLITGRVGTLGKLHVCHDPVWPSDNALVIRPRPDVVSFSYLRYALGAVIHLAIGMNRGAANPLVTQTDLGKLVIPVPDAKIQAEIAAVLTSLDDRITLLRETNTTLEAIAQALFKSWFVDFDPVHAKMQGRAPEGMDKATAALFPDSFEESELGPVPKGWKFGSLSDLCVIASGKRPVDRSDVLSDSCNIPLYGGAGVMGYTSESLFEDKKIVTGRVGTLGRVHVAYPPFWASDNVLVLSPRDETFFSFSFQWLCGIDVQALNRGSTQPLLTQKDLGAQVNVIPPRTLLEKFEEISAALNQQIRLQTLQAETLSNLRDTLLPRLISGELRTSSIAGDAA